MADMQIDSTAGAGPICLTTEEYTRLINHLERDAIRDVVVRYARGADRLDEELTRGASITKDTLHAYIRTLDLPAADEARLLALTPSTYIGLAEDLIDYARL